MSNCSGNNSAAEKESSNIKPGCTNAASDKEGCTGAATTIDTTSTTTTPATDTTATDEHSAASKALAATAKATIVGPKTQADAILGAVDIVLSYVTPTIKMFEELFGKIKAIKDVNYIETNLKLKQDFEKEATKNALEILLQKFIEENEGKTDENLLIQNLQEFKNAIEQILKMGVTPQSGGKKIISRTNKSIKQFLNPKITFANMLKNKSKHKRITKKRRRNK